MTLYHARVRQWRFTNAHAEELARGDARDIHTCGARRIFILSAARRLRPYFVGDIDHAKFSTRAKTFSAKDAVLPLIRDHHAPLTPLITMASRDAWYLRAHF